MPAAKSPEFRRRALELAEQGFPVSVACRVLGVSRSGFYEWRNRPASRRTMADRELVLPIRHVLQQSRGAYGAGRVHAESQGLLRV